MKPRDLRETMPTIAGWIDELREVFGADQINPSIRAGIDGQPTFYASENGVEIGTKDTRPGLTINHIQIDPPAASAAVGQGNKRARTC